MASSDMPRRTTPARSQANRCRLNLKSPPVKQIQQHVCSFRLYSHDLTRQIRKHHHYVARVNQDFLQGVEYIVSDRIFESLQDEEKKLWHSHAYESPEMLQKAELSEMAKTNGKFWCTWQVDRGESSCFSSLWLSYPEWPLAEEFFLTLVLSIPIKIRQPSIPDAYTIEDA
ncbi:hypothetical protein AMTRI_Chr01g108820 [Amborella trichopoda]